jgi:hypothetical protein
MAPAHGWVKSVNINCAQSASQGVIGFDSDRRSRGSVPRKATMISLTIRRKTTSAANKQHAPDENDQRAYALAG